MTLPLPQPNEDEQPKTPIVPSLDWWFNPGDDDYIEHILPRPDPGYGRPACSDTQTPEGRPR